MFTYYLQHPTLSPKPQNSPTPQAMSLLLITDSRSLLPDKREVVFMVLGKHNTLLLWIFSPQSAGHHVFSVVLFLKSRYLLQHSV
jgi:hypothetical protein